MARLTLVVVACALVRDVAAFGAARARLPATRARAAASPALSMAGIGRGYADAMMEKEAAAAAKSYAKAAANENRPGDSLNPLFAVGDLLVQTEEAGLLTQVAESGLLSKLEAAGYTFADIEPLLYIIEDSGIVGATGELAGPLLPFAPKLIELAPAGLPLALGALNVPSGVYLALAAASPVGAYLVTSLPDDSVASVALQTLVGVPLATIFPALFFGLNIAVGKLNSKA